MSQATDRQYVYVIIRARYLTGDGIVMHHDFKSLTSLMRIRNTDRDSYLRSVLSLMNLKDQWYGEQLVDQVIFDYKVQESESTAEMPKSLFDDRVSKRHEREMMKYTFHGYKLPLPNTSD